jgi:tRNA (cytidine/uridine-2'-O-)-methyltransferase
LEFAVTTSRLNVVLYQPEIPQNTGNIGRTCVATDSKLWIVRPAAFRLDDRRLRRSGLDYWQHLNWQALDDWPSLEREMPAGRTWFFSKAGRHCYTHADFLGGDFLVFGSETRGLPDSLLELHADRSLHIPMTGPVRSLNLSNAVAVAVFEALRQIRDSAK